MEETDMKPMSREAIALAEKKMSMTLEDIIKMSKKSSFKAKKKAPQGPIKGCGSGGAPQVKSAKVQRFMEPRSFLRQGVLAQKRSKFQEKHFPLASEVAKTFVATPVLPKGSTLRKPVNWRKPRDFTPQTEIVGASYEQRGKAGSTTQTPKTLDSRFANLKELRRRALQQLKSGMYLNKRNAPRQQQWGHWLISNVRSRAGKESAFGN